ncbi:WIYLD domain [Sesbania bispinosa]|nr:WIYLD domain [Sesbania bispinosa]
MAPNPKVVAAYRAMANLGIHESKVKPVLRKLLKLYDKNWELIEEENYRALADAIFEEDENKVPEPDQKIKRKQGGETDDEEAHMHDEPLRPLKMLRLRSQEVQSSRLLTSCGPSSAAFPLKTPKLEDGTMPQSNSRLQPQNTTVLPDGNARIEAHQVPPRDVIVDKGKQPVSPQDTPRGRRSIYDRTTPAVPFKEPTVEPGASLSSKNKMPHSYTFIMPKDEPVDDILDNEVPLAVIHPEPSSGRDYSMKNDSAGLQDGHDTVASQGRGEDGEGEDILPSSNEEVASNVELTPSSMGEEGPEEITPTVDSSKEFETNDTLIAKGKKDFMRSCVSNGSINIMSSPTLVVPQVHDSSPGWSGLDGTAQGSEKAGMNDFLESDGRNELERPSVNAPKHQPTTGDIRDIRDVNDITKGEERVKVSWVNNSTNDSPTSFHYIPRNLVFKDAYVNFSLSQIRNEDCCSTCMGNCVLSSKPCSCSNKTGGEFAYTAQGLLKEEFLDECIAIIRDPQNYFYCKDCPLERSKSDDCLEPCKGHLKRKFIKECWSKCGCDGKGWGLRTLEDLPKGAFICEFVGEILTVKELHERNLKYPKNGKFTYPILLDADWGSRAVKDNEALCLYAATFGNAARFINHRCLDANLIEIPVEVEGPTHHYYHFAFFTSRKIATHEELTWDYGVNFDDHDQLVELFRCRCGSKFCRNMKRSNRSIKSSTS